MLIYISKKLYWFKRTQNSFENRRKTTLLFNHSKDNPMKDNAKKLDFFNVNGVKMSEFLDRFTHFDENLLLEITPTEFYAKTYTPDRSAIKYSALKFDELLQIKDENLPENLKVGLIGIKQYQQALKFLEGSEQVSMGIQYMTIAGLDTEEENVAVKTSFNNNNDLQFSFENGSLTIYGVITNEKFFNEIANIDQPTFAFDLSLEDLVKIKKFSNIDKINNNLNAEYRKGSVIFGNQTFKYRLASQNNEGNGENSARFPKTYLNMLDNESYRVKVSESRIVFTSQDSQTILVVGRNDA